MSPLIPSMHVLEALLKWGSGRRVCFPIVLDWLLMVNGLGVVNLETIISALFFNSRLITV